MDRLTLSVPVQAVEGGGNGTSRVAEGKGGKGGQFWHPRTMNCPQLCAMSDGEAFGADHVWNPVGDGSLSTKGNGTVIRLAEIHEGSRSFALIDLSSDFAVEFSLSLCQCRSVDVRCFSRSCPI